MAIIEEDLGKGLTADEVVRSAQTIALPAGEYEWADKASPSQSAQNQQQQSQRQQAQRLAQQYAARIQQVFAQVAAQAARLIAQWLSGALAVTAAGLAAMITALIAELLGPVLRVAVGGCVGSRPLTWPGTSWAPRRRAATMSGMRGSRRTARTGSR